jgi:hypothetical protein
MIGGEFVVYKAETEVVINEHGAFLVNIWKQGDEYHVHALQADSMNSMKSYIYDKNRMKAVNDAIEHVVEFNKKYSV